MVKPDTQKFDARDCWSGTNFKQAKQLLTVIQGTGSGQSFQAHFDDSAKIGLLVPARSRASPRGFVLTRRDGETTFSQLDHDFAVGSRMNICTIGVVTCDVPSEACVLPSSAESKPQYPIGRPIDQYLGVRAHRYNPPNIFNHMEDFMRVVEKSEKARIADAVLLGGDNGGGFTIDAPEIQHLFVRLFVNFGWCIGIMAAQVANHSSWHWEVEKEWAWIRQAIFGHHFGWGALTADGNPLKEPEENEDVFRAVTAKGIEEYISVVADAARRLGKNVTIEHHGPTRHVAESLVPDDALIKEYYSITKKIDRTAQRFADIAKEAAFLQRQRQADRYTTPFDRQWLSAKEANGRDDRADGIRGPDQTPQDLPPARRQPGSV